MTWVGASVRAFPSIFPFTMKASPPAVVVIATLDSTPSASQKVRRRWSRSHSWTRLGEALDRLTRPAPIGLCRQAAVGPVIETRATLAAAAPSGIHHRTRVSSRRPRETARAARASAESSSVTKTQVPVAERMGRSPKPPAREPTIAPAVFQA